jgi:hypothetical protein
VVTVRPPGNDGDAGILIGVGPDTLYCYVTAGMAGEAKVISPHGGHGCPVP